MNPLDEEKRAFVRYRLEKAEEAYLSAKIIFDASLQTEYHFLMGY